MIHKHNLPNNILNYLEYRNLTKERAMAFNNFCHVTIVSGDENITLQGHHIIQCCHLPKMVLEKPETQRQQCLFSYLIISGKIYISETKDITRVQYCVEDAERTTLG